MAYSKPARRLAQASEAHVELLVLLDRWQERINDDIAVLKSLVRAASPDPYQQQTA